MFKKSNRQMFVGLSGHVEERFILERIPRSVDRP